jgi:hypothetical protein
LAEHAPAPARQPPSANKVAHGMDRALRCIIGTSVTARDVLHAGRMRRRRTLPDTEWNDILRPLARMRISSEAAVIAFVASAASASVVGCGRQQLDLLPDLAVDAGSDARRPYPSSPECQDDSECRRARPICDSVRGQCVECLGARDCDVPSSCNPSSQRCAIPCSADGDCNNTSICDTAHGFCVECRSDDDCGPRNATRCEISSGECVECLDDRDCPRDEPFCDPDVHVCRG